MNLPEVGQIFENFKILRDLGSGGMGHVLLAEDIKLRRKVALKFLGQGQEKLKGTLISRFEQEARALASLNHPNIVNIYAIGKHLEYLYLVMEYVEGENLGFVMDVTQIDHEKALSIIKQVLRGMNEAHNKGILHRDIKPENILIDKDNKVKIVDFGICKDMSDESERITKENLILGTISYMAPEVIQFQSPGPAADIFSLGVVLYEMVVGRHPFQGSAAASRMYRICHDPIKFPRELYDKVPVGLPELIEKMTSIVLDYRYKNAVEVLNDLENLSAVVLPTFRSVELESDVMYSDALEAKDALLMGGYDMDEALRIIEMAQAVEEEDDSSEMELQIARMMAGTDKSDFEIDDKKEEKDLNLTSPLSKKSVAQAMKSFDKNKKLIMPKMYQKPKLIDLNRLGEFTRDHPKVTTMFFLIVVFVLVWNRWDSFNFKNTWKTSDRSVASISTDPIEPLSNGNVLKIERERVDKLSGESVFKIVDELEIVSSSGDIVFSKLKDGETKIESTLQFARNPFLPPLRKVVKGKFDTKNIIVGSSKKVFPLTVGKTFDVLFTTLENGRETQSSRFCEVKGQVEIQGTQVFQVNCNTRMGSQEVRSEMYYSPKHNMILREVRTLHEEGKTFVETHQVVGL